jgi:hypothetical protein
MRGGPQLAQYIARTQPGVRGFTRANLLRMRQFYETYRDDSIVAAPLLRQLPRTQGIDHSRAKQPARRAPSFTSAWRVQERWSNRQLERQPKAALFERAVLPPAKVSADATNAVRALYIFFNDAYMLEFLDLLAGHVEADLHRALLLKLKDFLI